MATQPRWNPKRGTYWVQWKNGDAWVRTTVTKRPRGWKPGDPEPKRIPPEAFEAMADLQRKERAARDRPKQDPDQKLSDFLSRYAEVYKGHRAPGSVEQLDAVIALFVAWCDERGVSLVREVKPATCQDWIQHRLGSTSQKTGDKIERPTVKKERGLLSGAWSAAVKVEQLESNPWTKTDIPGKTARKPRGSWSPEEYGLLIAKCRPWLRDLIMVGCYTGLRIEALMGLEWRDVRFAKMSEGGFGTIVVRPELDKTGRGYEIPILDVCHDVLARRATHQNDGPTSAVLTAARGARIKRSNQTYKAITAACKAAGLPKPDSPNHHMRRTFGRWAVIGHLTGRPIPMYTVSQWMGHSSVEMTEKYLAMTRADSTRWAERVHDGPFSANASEGQDPVST